MKKIVSLIFITIFGTSSAFADNIGRGPFEIANLYPLAIPHLSFTPGTPRSVAADETLLSLQGSWSNTNNYRERYIVDAENRELTLKARYGIWSNTDLSAQLPLLWRGGGVLDSPIDAWHRFWGFPRGMRDRVEDNQFQIAGENDDGREFDWNSRGIELGDLVVGSKTLLTPGDDLLPAVGVEFRLSVPTATDSTYGHDAVDGDISLHLSKSISQFFLYGSLGYLYFGDDDIAGVQYESNQFGASLAAEYHFEQWSIILSGIYSSSLLSAMNGFPDYTIYVDTGVKIALGKQTELELVVRENAGQSHGTVDVSFIAGLNYRL